MQQLSSTPPWVTAGYLQNTFHVAAFDTTNVDTSLTGNSGYKFYLNGTFGNPDTLPSHVILNSDGSVTLTGNTGTGGNVGSSISSVGVNNDGPVTDWHGTAFGGGAYFEATMSFDPSAINAVSGANGFPAFWADPVEHAAESSINSDNWVNQAQWFVHFTELDFFEYNVWAEDNPLFTYNGTVIDWSGTWNWTSYPGNIQNTAHIQLPVGTDFTQPHSYGFLWVPAVNGGPQGYFEWYFDGLPTSDRVSYDYYDPVNPPSPPATTSSPWLYGVADSQHYQLFLNSDTVSSLRVYSVDVWQASSAGNIVGRAEAAADFKGDGKADILWQTDSGAPAIWTMDGTNLTSGVALPNVGHSWHVKAAADFNGDGKSDILWQNDNGTPGIWLMNGLNPVAEAAVGSNPGPSWHIKAAGDFNGDGKSDILWQNDNGTPAIWLMDGTNVIGEAVPGGSNPGPSWHIKAAGDFNGDGKSDILWQNDNGTPGIWLMNGLNPVAEAAVGSNPGPSWHIKAAGDFNGDGKSDILWQNDNGTPGIWLMNGLNPVAEAAVGSNPGPSWHIKAADDFNGDGKSDILWQNDNGLPSIWTMHGTNIDSAVALPNPGSDWHLF